MIVSKYGKSYDTADGSAPLQSEVQAASQRWEDDGGPLDDPPAVFAGELTTKPPWSVLSLEYLNESIRRERRADDPARLQQELERTERGRIRAIEVHDERVAAAARTKRDRYGNAWEHSLVLPAKAPAK